MKSFSQQRMRLRFQTPIAAIQQEACFECRVMTAPQKVRTENIGTGCFFLYAAGSSEGTVQQKRARLCQRKRIK